MSDARRPVIAVSMGDPCGIGPEVVVKALADPALRRCARFHVYGAQEPMLAAADLAEIEPYWWRVQHDSPLAETTTTHPVVVLDYDEHATPAAGAVREPTRAAGEASFRYVEDAIAAARRPESDPLRADAIVTGPINKRAWALAGRGKHRGHTELLAMRFGAKRVGMFFDSPKLRVILATIHLPLMDVRNVLTIGRVFDAIDLGNDACKRLGVARPRIGVCGLNPHAGEDGLMGDEESRLIEPAIQHAREQGIDVRGPFPADTIFNHAVGGAFDLVVAMYHDQGLIPVKLLGWEEAVNVTVGLPVPRTSPDHGTAFDIAGKNAADERSMRRAIELAVRLAAPAGVPAPG
ncbi:MAG: 4-hydroxythreonine-4-phosphate dehydrogenase PdxA [Phycisphaerales bacterium]|nr:MAG: 4-hydroxythreonine-4-phosphate dehydrogenase PdxA [Phycisphaerales bacterium]